MIEQYLITKLLFTSIFIQQNTLAVSSNYISIINTYMQLQKKGPDHKDQNPIGLK